MGRAVGLLVVGPVVGNVVMLGVVGEDEDGAAEGELVSSTVVGFEVGWLVGLVGLGVSKVGLPVSELVADGSCRRGLRRSLAMPTSATNTSVQSAFSDSDATRERATWRWT